MTRLKDWDGRLHRISAGMYSLNTYTDPEDVQVQFHADRDPDLQGWTWDVVVDHGDHGQAKSDNMVYRTKREAVAAALSYVRYGEGSAPVRPLDGALGSDSE